MKPKDSSNLYVFFVISHTVKTPIKRPAYFHFLDKMSLNFELSLNYKISNFNIFCGVFSLLLPIFTLLLVFKGSEMEKTLIGSTFRAKTLE